MLKNKATHLLGINYPIIQAPMAGGITSTSLVSAASNAGALGMIGAGYMTPEQLRVQIKEVRANTEKPFGVNLFIPEVFQVSQYKLEAMDGLLQPLREALQVKDDSPILPSTESVQLTFAKQIDVLLEEKVPIISFAFGLPSNELIAKFKENGTILIGTATTVTEALLAEKAGMDMIVLQGSEAGGHRATFDKVEQTQLIGLMSLIPQASDAVKIPVIAAGGIMDARGLVASIFLGASAVQMGTAFLTCVESGAHPIYKEAVLSAKEEDTIVTTAFSGKAARGIKNTFMTKMAGKETLILDYPVQNTLTTAIRKQASVQQNSEYMSLWCGQSPRMAKAQTVEQLIDNLIGNAASILNEK